MNAEIELGQHAVRAQGDGHLNVCCLEKEEALYWLKANAMQKT